MTWAERIDTRQGDMAHGIRFVMFESHGRAEAAIKEKKAHLDGRVALTLALGQHRYGDELIAQLYTSEPHRVRPRRSDAYSRVQIYLGAADEDTAVMLETAAARIREHLREKGDG